MEGVRRIDLAGKAWRDRRGWGTDPLEAAGLAGKPVHDFHIVSLKPGAVRGNHAHGGATEWLMVCGGPAKIAWRMDPQAPVQEVHLDKDSPALFKIPPRIDHAVRNTSTSEILVVSFRDAPGGDVLACAPLFAG